MGILRVLISALLEQGEPPLSQECEGAWGEASFLYIFSLSVFRCAGLARCLERDGSVVLAVADPLQAAGVL